MVKQGLQDHCYDMHDMGPVQDAIDAASQQLNSQQNQYTHFYETGEAMKEALLALAATVEDITGEDVPVEDRIMKEHAKFVEGIKSLEGQAVARMDHHKEMLEKVRKMVYGLKNNFEDKMRESIEDALVELTLYEQYTFVQG